MGELISRFSQDFIFQGRWRPVLFFFAYVALLYGLLRLLPPDSAAALHAYITKLF